MVRHRPDRDTGCHEIGDGLDPLSLDVGMTICPATQSHIQTLRLSLRQLRATAWHGQDSIALSRTA
jgi:hypothetical protein